MTGHGAARGLALALAWLCLGSSPAAAERAVLFAPVGHSDLAEHLGPAAVEALEQGLTAAGWESLSPEQAGAQLDERRVERCTRGSCVADMLRALEADTAIAIAIWARHGETTPYEVALTMMPRDPPMVNATARVHDGDVPAATREALALALGRWGRRHAVTLRVLGTPPGAAVTVDGRPAGRLPLEVHLDAGEHDVSVSQRGHVTQRQEFVVPEAGAPVVVRVALDVDPEAARAASQASAPVAAAPHDSVRATTRPILGPALLAGAGAAAVVWGAWAASRAGCLARNAAGDCVRERRFSGGEKAGHAASLIGGGLALVGAALWFSLGGSGDSAQLSLGPRGAQLRLRF